MTALEEIGIEYEDRMVNIRTDEQKSAGYLAINAKGKGARYQYQRGCHDRKRRNPGILKQPVSGRRAAAHGY